jgi:hypothetical protein
VSLIAKALSTIRPVVDAANTVYEILFDESFVWEVVHAACVKLGIPKWLSWLILGGTTMSVAYYFAVVRKLASVYVKAQSRAAQITERMNGILAQPYAPTPWAFNRHLTTILGSEIRWNPQMMVRRCVLKATNGQLGLGRISTPISSSLFMLRWI